MKDNDGNIVITFSDSSIIQFATMETTEEICSSSNSDKEVLLSAILTSFISSGNFEATSEYSKTDIKGFFVITQEATFSSLYDCTLYCFFSENNAYILAFSKSQLLEAKEAYDLQYEIIDSFEFESSDTEELTTEKVTEPITEPPTERPVETQLPVIETSPVQTTLHFILNLETSCIHIDPNCSAALKILPENYLTVDIADSDLWDYNGIYWACGKCSKSYTDILPKF